MAKESKNSRQVDRNELILKELEGMKRLLAVFLLKAGTPQSEVAFALQIDQGNLSRVLPAKKFKLFREEK
jgi:hypothetical protein